MKKQKFCYSRFLSIILSLALLCSALVFPVSVNAATDDAAKAAAATALKTAWQEMYAAKGETFAYPNAILSDGWKNTEKTLLLSDNPKMDLYADINLVDYTSQVQVVYGKEIHEAENKPYCNIYIESSIYSQKTGFYFYVYAENLTNDVTLNFGFNWGGTIAGEKSYTIPAGTNGYVRIEDTHLFNDYKTSLGTTRIDTIWVTIQPGFGSGNLKFGSLYWKNSNTELGLDSLTDDDLLLSALKLHTENVYYPEYVEKFETALAALKACYDAKDLAVLELKAAWEEIETNTAEYANSTSGSRKTSSAEQKGKLGTYYYQLDTSTLVDTNTAKYSNKKYIVWQDQKNYKSITQKSGDGFYFYIYVDKEITAPITLTLNANWTSSCNNNADLYYTIPAGTTAGTYIKVTDRDLFTEGYKTLYKKYSDQANFNLFFTSKGQGTISVGSVFAYKRATVPDSSDTWSLEKFANYTVNYIDNNNYIISDTFRKLFADAQKLGAGVYNGDFANGGDGFTLLDSTLDEQSGKYYHSYFDDESEKIVVENVGWKPNQMLKNKVVIEPNTEYVLTYRFKASAKTDYIRSGINLVGNNESLDSSKISITVSSNAELGDYGSWAPTTWINGIKHTNTEKLVNVAVRFNSGDNDYLNMSMAFQGDCNYTYDYFKLTKADDVEIGNVNGDSEVDILDLVVLKKFLNDGDTNITFEAAKVNNTGTTVNNDDFNALRSKLLDPTFQ